jgi:hypothetical protein
MGICGESSALFSGVTECGAECVEILVFGVRLLTGPGDSGVDHTAQQNSKLFLKAGETESKEKDLSKTRKLEVGKEGGYMCLKTGGLEYGETTEYGVWK